MSKIHPLKAYRKAYGLTMEEVAKKIGNCNRSLIWKWETRRIPAERVLDVAKATGIPLHRLRPDIYPAPKRENA
jgi:transcriptional regulator with XRE-family HTH domain